MNARRFVIQMATGLLIAGLCAWSAEADPLTFYPTDDADIGENPSGGRGLIPYMVVRNRYGAGGTHWECDSLVRFDVSSIPPETEITSATLHLYYYNWVDHNPAGRALTCYRITSDWDEEEVTWATRPTWLPSGQWTDSTRVPSSFGWMEWDVTEDVQAFVDGGVTDYGWCIMDENYWGSFDIPFTIFRTRQHDSYVPYLEVIPEPASLVLLLAGGTLLRPRRP